MNRRHLAAFVWLRWRLLINGARRGGTLNAVLTSILVIGLMVLAVPLFVACLLIGLHEFAQAAPERLLYAWDGLVAGFTFVWLIGLVAELQRTDSLSPSKFLHLPLSPGGVFFVNYLSSLFSLRLVLFLPVLFGFALALIYTHGALTWFVLPLTVAFLWMVTAVTSQFQGWIASLVDNPRRRRTVIIAITGVFLLVCQLPNLLTLYGPGAGKQQLAATYTQEMRALDAQLKSSQIDPANYVARQKELSEKFLSAGIEADRQLATRWNEALGLLNLVLPIGWLPLGVQAAVEGRIGPPIVGLAAMTLIAVVSLWRAHRTTLAIYRGEHSARVGRSTVPAAASKTVATSAVDARPAARRWLDSQLPGASEPASAIAQAGWRALWRAPEIKMILLTPAIFCIALVSVVAKLPAEITDIGRPMLAVGAIGLALFGLMQLMGNQFGFDRDGFRVFVLCAIPRRDILLGKNLAFAPLALAMAAAQLAVIEVLRPLRIEHLLSMAPQFVSMYLLFCLLTNLMSIYAAIPVAAGSLKPANPKLLPVLVQLAMFLLLFPPLEAFTLLPMGVEALLAARGLAAGWPVCLLLSLVECAAVVAFYREALAWQGRLLHAREQRILEIVTNRGL